MRFSSVLARAALAAALFATPARAVVPGPAAPADSLPAWLAAVAEGPLARAHWGVAVWDLDARAWVLRHQADRYFVPASNLKLVVAAVALDRLGPDYAWRTSVYGTGPVSADGTLEGDLVLYGRGDPNLSGRYADRITAIPDALADSLAARGVRRIAGDVLADGTHWDADHLRGDWAAYDVLWWYAAPVGALGFNDNAIDFAVRPGARVGDPVVVEGEPESAFWTLENRATTAPPGTRSTFDLTRAPGTNRVIAYGALPLDASPRTEYFAVVDPAGWAAAALRDALERKGIEVDGAVRTVENAAASPVAAGDTVALAAWSSPPLAKVVETIVGRSQNWHAEMMLKTLGKELAGEGSWRAGLAVERAVLDSLGVDTTAFLLRDASGLSAANLATPAALVDLLATMRRSPGAGPWIAAFPVAGETGSLRRRFRGTVGESRVRAKTGFIENVYSLSGYLETVSGRKYAFSVIVNQTGPGSGAATQAIDRLVNAIVSETALAAAPAAAAAASADRGAAGSW